MRAFLVAMALAVGAAIAPSALAAEPSPSPKPLPIRGVTVDVQQMQEQPGGMEGATHIEAPPFAPRQFRMHEGASPKRSKVAPSPSPSPTYR